MGKNNKKNMRIAFDVIGSKEKAVAVIYLPLDQRVKAAEEIMKRYKHIKSVLAKHSPRTGEYRIYEYKLVKGDKNTEVCHREHGCDLKLDPQKVFFSPRESEERQRIAKKVKNGEKILIMFSGIGPYAIAIAKKTITKKQSCEIICIDINRDAVNYAELNARLNNAGGIKNYCWDAREASAFGKFNRIIMPLPESASEFLDSALDCSKKGTIIHIYGISNQKNFFSDFEKKLRDSKKSKKDFKVTGKQKVLPYAPGRFKVRLDLEVL